VCLLFEWSIDVNLFRYETLMVLHWFSTTHQLMQIIHVSLNCVKLITLYVCSLLL